MHIFLTGEIQIGKSTALRRFLAQSGLAVDGFLTYFEQIPGGRELFLEKYGAGERRRAALFSGGEMEVYAEVFDTFGAEVLAGAGRRQLILMDELGAMEERAPRFKAEVFRRLDGEIPVAGVVKLRDSPFLDAVRAHPNVQMVTVTRENRDGIPAALLAAFARGGSL
jgi:nucleoside-triphosphatase